MLICNVDADVTSRMQYLPKRIDQCLAEIPQRSIITVDVDVIF
jgi:hypothetical protein